MDKNLIIKFLQRECSPEEEKIVVDWIHSSDFEPDLLSHIEDDLISQKAEADESHHLHPLIHKIILRDQMEHIDSERKFEISTRKRESSAKWFMKVAATLLIAFTVSYIINLFNNQQETDLQPVSETIIKENTKGRRSTLALPDGSVVKLNADSKIEYVENFTDSSRIVYLEGEAFFEVEKDSLRPFIVQTENISVTALGTSFNVFSYAEEDKISVALASGKVVVSEEDEVEQVLLEPGKRVEYDKKGNQFTELEEFDAISVYGWKDGILYFKSATLPQVISRLERWFDVKIIVRNANTFPWSYTGEFDNQSLKSVMESLSFSQNFDYVIDKKTKTVTINFNNE